ncbi:response regulator transcription factor [Hahella ganghwensis]|uniref:response regulator transcription factor n=1 Tax=Hahella ganghwensis TaxID=286420 RepID=UPI0003A533C9|nr:response regulator transcription factor [Hahella ganghwensis]
MSLWNPAMAAKRHRFLVVEDEEDIAELVALHLGDLNGDVTTEGDGARGLEKALNDQWDMVFLDLRLPTVDGLDICRALRSQASYVPVMMVTSRSSELDKVLGLEIGADDYLVKPFSMIELKARVKALLRRAHQSRSVPAPEDLEYGELLLNLGRRKVAVRDQELELTAKEFDLLWFFASHPGQVFKRYELLNKVWGYGYEGYEHTVNSHINRLRSKLEPDPAHPKFIETVWGVGYRFREPASL